VLATKETDGSRDVSRDPARSISLASGGKGWLAGIA